MHQAGNMMRRAASRLGLAELVPYQTRHSWASLDRVLEYRSLAEVNQRGQWWADKSVVRYDKHARLAHGYHLLGTALRAHLGVCELSLEDTLVCGKFVAPLTG